ncbi:MAG: outer membrane protein assembly factor BamD [Chthoniobacterales bacterium]
MDLRVRVIVIFLAAWVAFPALMKAPVVFKPGAKAKYVPPGEEELSGSAKELFDIAQKAENRGNLKRALSAYKSLIRHHPKDALAPGAVYRAAQLQEQMHIYIPAAQYYRLLVEHFPSSPHFDEAIEAQFRIGELYLRGKKQKVLGVALGSPLERAVEIFAAVVRTAPYGKYTARAQFNIGLAREKQDAVEAALDAYQAVIDKFPNEPVAAAAQYQIGYIWFQAARAGSKDINATAKAKTAFQDFLFRYPNNEKAAQARAYLERLEKKQTSRSFQVAQFYDKQKKYRAAVIYYNEVIRQQPGSKESEDAKKRIDQLRAKLGDTALQPAYVAAEEAKKKEAEKNKAQGAGGATATATPTSERTQAEPASSNSASTPEPAGSTVDRPVSPPASDLVQPPPSLLPDRNPFDTAPEPSATPESSPTP